MKKRALSPHFFFAIICLSLMSLPFVLVMDGRATFLHIASIASAPFSKVGGFVSAVKNGLQPDKLAYFEQKLAKSELENMQLKELLAKQQEHIGQIGRFTTLMQPIEPVACSVIARAPSAWSSSLWIDGGEKTNEKLGKKAIAINSPVLSGEALIGIIDYVGPQKSRVRLITDSGLTPSVRAARGHMQKLACEHAISFLLREFSADKNLLGNENEKILAILDSIRLQLSSPGESLLLAKGELHGSSMPLWRPQKALLKGIGFNYDFGDEAGEARDLRSGAPISPFSKAAPLPLLLPQDILITTGMDGVFPAGILVAEVVSVKPLQEGDYTYELEALPIAGNLEELTSVLVLPPVE
jgi:cell shape-determining protein MreC